MALSKIHFSKELLVKVIVKNVARRKSAKDVMIKLVKEIKKNIRQPNFKALVLGLYYYHGDNVKYGLLSKVVPKNATTWRLRKLQC